LLVILERAHTDRSDLWHAWSALVSQYGHLGRLDKARDVAKQAAEKFPHLPRIWLDLANVHQWRNEPDEEIAAAEHAFEIGPGWSRATLTLTDALARRGRMDDARQIFERALQHSNQDTQLHATHAHLLWRQRRKDAAFEAVERALRLAPGYEWAWGLLNEWANESGTPERTGKFARALTQERPGEKRCWLMLALVLNNPADVAERLAAVEKALALDELSIETWDLKAELLTTAERFDEAIQACEAGIEKCTSELFVLRGRRAWIEAQRREFAEAVRLIRAVLAENSSGISSRNGSSSRTPLSMPPALLNNSCGSVRTTPGSTGSWACSGSNRMTAPARKRRSRLRCNPRPRMFTPRTTFLICKFRPGILPARPRRCR
jgi:cellulose synthase operon protein C